MRFEELEVSEKIIRAVSDMGFEEMTPIQAQAIPIVLSGADIIGQAQTGTGKTAAYTIPMLEKIDAKKKCVQGIILCPTRELAIQVADEVRKIAKYFHGIKVLPVYGGTEIVRQIKALKTGVQIIVGTPGRVMDHMRRKTVKFDGVNMVVLDEADEMLNMGFREDMETILSQMPLERQTVLFSATMPEEIVRIAKTYQRSPQTIKVVRKELTVTNIEQFYVEVKKKNKTDILCRMLDVYNPKLSVIFCNTKRNVDELVEALKGRGYFAEGLHGDLKQSQRDKVMGHFRKGSTEILVATDVAARGIDVDDVDIVFNYDIPQDEEYYVHRIGRTGRAGKCGLAVSFVSGREIYKLKDIQRYCKTKILYKAIPCMDEVQKIRIEKLFEQIEETMETQSLDKIIRILEDKLEESDYTATEVAAALIRQQFSDNASNRNDVQGTDAGFSAVDFADTGASEDGMARLFINIGKKDKIKPGNILGAIAGECRIPGKLVGTIDMYDCYTFVEVPVEVAGSVLHAMKNAKIKGKAVNMEPANQNR